MIDEHHEVSVPNKSLHIGFSSIYLLLISWLFLNVFAQLDERYIGLYRFVNRLSKSFYRPFLGTLVWVDVQAVLYAVFSFAFLHFAIIRFRDIQPTSKMLEKIVNIFRFTFFFSATLLALLIVVRLTIDTYRDLTGRGRDVYPIMRPVVAPDANRNTAR